MGIMDVRQSISDFIFCTLTDISPELNTRLRYRRYYKKKLNLDNPRSFTEKLLWLKTYKYADDPLVKQCADKFAVRQYVSDAGYDDILVPLLGIYDSPSQIDFSQLPDKFVLKWNFGSGFNIICSDKNRLNIKDTLAQLSIWEKKKIYRYNAEMQYKGVKKKILCEKFLETDNGEEVIPDYKVYCFNGLPRAILVMHDRGHGVKTEFFDTDWNPLTNSSKYASPKNKTPKPICLEYLLQIASDLSKPFPFVRCDFYIIGNRVFFGEMTFTPAGGLYASETTIDGKDMGEILDIGI